MKELRNFSPLVYKLIAKYHKFLSYIRVEITFLAVSE